MHPATDDETSRGTCFHRFAVVQSAIYQFEFLDQLFVLNILYTLLLRQLCTKTEQI